MASKKPRREFRLYLTKDLAFKLDTLCTQNGIDPVDLVSGAIQHLWLMAEKEIAEQEAKKHQELSKVLDGDDISINPCKEIAAQPGQFSDDRDKI